MEKPNFMCPILMATVLSFIISSPMVPIDSSLQYLFICPSLCICTYDKVNRDTISADCSGRNLRSIPSYLPNSLNSLDMSDNQLQEIHPQDFENLHLLRCLDLRKNHLKRLQADTFSSLTQLLHLNLSDNQISQVDSHAFRNLSSLKVLNLRNNSLFSVSRTLPGTFFEGLTNLLKLNLQLNIPAKSRICYPDRALSILSNLQQLYIDGLPSHCVIGFGFQNLTQLRLLSFGSDSKDSCRIEALPSQFFSNITTKNHVHVNFKNCIIKSIDNRSFSLLPTLKSLVLAGNVYLNFDQFFAASKSFASTQLSFLDISAIRQGGYDDTFTLQPNYFQFLRKTSIEKLIMRSNNITLIPQGILSNLPIGLKHWDISDNHLMIADFDLNELVNLEWFNMSVQNKLFLNPFNSDKNRVINHVGTVRSVLPFLDYTPAILPKTSGKYENTIDKRSIQDLNEKMATSELTSSLPQQYCPSYKPTIFNRKSKTRYGRHEVGFTIRIPNKLTHFYASGLNIASFIPRIVFSPANKLEHVSLAYDFFWCFGGPLLGLSHLKYVDLSYNYAVGLNPSFFTYMPSIKHLDLRFNAIGYSLQLDSAGKTFSFLTKLEYLDLSDTNLHSLSPKAFINNTQLRKLIIKRNGFSKFSPQISQLSFLRYLDLSFNFLQRLSEENMKNLDEITKTSDISVNLSNNTLKCDCDSSSFLRWYLKNTKVIFIKYDSYYCRLTNGSLVRMAQLHGMMDDFWRICVGPDIIVMTVTLFFSLVIMLTVTAVFTFQRYKLFYYVHLNKQRFFYDFRDYNHQNDIFLVFDSQDILVRRHVLEVMIPNLTHHRITYHVSEVGIHEPFAGRHIRDILEEAVLCGRKTLVLLTRDIFLDEEPQLAVAMARVIQDLKGTQVLIFVGYQKVRGSTMPVHLHRFLRSNRIIRYMPNSPLFWTSLSREIRK